MDSRSLLKTLTLMKLKRSGGILPVGGYSMIPLLVAGDNVRLDIRDGYSIGDIVICIDSKARLLVHRIIDTEKDENGETVYVTKGDNAVASELIEKAFCIGKVTEAFNKWGKQLKFGEPSEHDMKIVEYSRKVNKIYTDTQDPNAAYSSSCNVQIYDMAPDDIKEYVYKAQDYMVQKAKEYVTGDIQPPDESFVYTRDFYSMLVNHRVVNVISPMFSEACGRFNKMFKLAKARNLAAARQRLEWSRRITAAFEKENIIYAVYKGITISHIAYKNDILRECDDIDILVHPGSIQRAHSIMLELGFAQKDAQGLHTEEIPLTEYPTHLTPYTALSAPSVTCELHTALYITEDHTDEILSRRRMMNADGYEFYAMSDADIYVCQLYTTAADDFGCANMTYEEDPNIFLQLKFRNYLDIALLSRELSGISKEYISELAYRYDISFYLYLALDYTCKIFAPAPFLGGIEDLRDMIKKREDICEKMYELPIDVRSCLMSPFKMKMNGAALIKLRDAYYMSRRWRVKQAEFQAGKYKELRRGETLACKCGCGSTEMRFTGTEVEVSGRVSVPGSNEFMITLRRMNGRKYRCRGDWCTEVLLIYCRPYDNTVRAGTLYIDDELPWEKRIRMICGIIRSGENKTGLRLEMHEKTDNIRLGQNGGAEYKVSFKTAEKDHIKKYEYMYISGRLFAIQNGEMSTVYRITYDEDENLKIVFDLNSKTY